MPQVKWDGVWTAPMVEVVRFMQQQGHEATVIHSELRRQFGRLAPPDWEVVRREMQDIYFGDYLKAVSLAMPTSTRCALGIIDIYKGLVSEQTTNSCSLDLHAFMCQF